MLFRSHDWLVYGFDDEQKLFKIIGFAPNEKNGVLKYEKHELPFEQFIKALPSTKVKTKAKYLKNCTISIKNDYEIENVNFKIIKRKLRMYLRTFSPFFLNIKIYEHYSKVLLRIKNKADYIDLRPLAVMRDHKYILLRLIQEFGDEGLVKDYEYVVNCAQDLLLLALKHNCSSIKDNRYKELMCEKLNLITKHERATLTCLSKIL